MPTLISESANIFYQTFGDAKKPALVLSNSLGTNYTMWQPQIDAFKNDYYVICYDTRGHGQSSAPQGPYRIDQLGLDVVNLLNELGIQKANFCGISMGGLTGLWLGIHASDHFHKIAVCNTAAKIGQEEAWLTRAADVRANSLDAIADTAAGRWFTQGFIEMHPDVVQRLSDILRLSSVEGYANCCEALAKADLRDAIQNIAVPTLVVVGKQDPVTTEVDGTLIRDRIDQAKMVILEASHISNIEASWAFNQALNAFLNGGL